MLREFSLATWIAAFILCIKWRHLVYKVCLYELSSSAFLAELSKFVLLRFPQHKNVQRLPAISPPMILNMRGFFCTRKGDLDHFCRGTPGTKKKLGFKSNHTHKLRWSSLEKFCSENPIIGEYRERFKCRCSHFHLLPLLPPCYPLSQSAVFEIMPLCALKYRLKNLGP